jgi:mono/diheme cytochrome c family protein
MVFAGIVILMQSCYNDNVEDLYPQAPACYTNNVTYANTVWPIINTNCISCHGGQFPSGNISLSDYSAIAAAAKNGSLLSAIRHEDGWSSMPKDGGKLSDCDIQKIEIWVNAGSADN